MPVVSMQELLKDAFEHRYGVAAINIVDDVTVRGILDAADEARSPIIIEVSCFRYSKREPVAGVLMIEKGTT